MLKSCILLLNQEMAYYYYYIWVHLCSARGRFQELKTGVHALLVFIPIHKRNTLTAIVKFSGKTFLMITMGIPFLQDGRSFCIVILLLPTREVQ